jgi:hypothetical protein
MDSSICVAVITVFAGLAAAADQLFLHPGRRSYSISTPISPRATMMPSARRSDVLKIVDSSPVFDLAMIRMPRPP